MRRSRRRSEQNKRKEFELDTEWSARRVDDGNVAREGIKREDCEFFSKELQVTEQRMDEKYLQE